MPARATPSGPGLPPCSAGPDVGRAPCRTVRPDERGGRLVVRDGARELDVPLQRLTVVRIEPWVYPLWPVAAVIDVLSVPMIVTTGPLIILFGD
jgi:hypothetical protein